MMWPVFFVMFLVIAVPCAALVAVALFFCVRGIVRGLRFETERRQLMLGIPLVLILATVYSVLQPWLFPTRADILDRFKQYIPGPVPQSVEIVDAETVGAYDYVHFKIDPADLDTILKSNRYVDRTSTWSVGPDGVPSWWKPESMVPGGRLYGRAPDPDDGHNSWKTVLIVNRQHDEAYLAEFDDD